MMKYRTAELYVVCPLPVNTGENLNGQIKLQIHSERGKTKWLNISSEEFKQIERILLGEKLS